MVLLRPSSPNNPTMQAGQAVVPAIEFVAVLATAFSGFAEARNKKMDSVGVFTVAFITAFGGGTLRDVLLDPPRSSGCSTSTTSC